MTEKQIGPAAAREMTAAANASSRHPGSLARWEEAARAADPELDDDLAAEYASRLRSEHYRELARSGADVRRAGIPARREAVKQLRAEGRSIAQIAARLGIHPRTVWRDVSAQRTETPCTTERE